MRRNVRQGFTIVELLIVVVVIAILSAITIVSFNGVTQRARIALISSDLDSATKRLSIDRTLNDSYPVTTAAANNGAGLRASTGTAYQYTVNNTANPQTFCITATNRSVSYYASSTLSIPTAGACAGHIDGGVPPITNLAINPSAEVDTSNWYTWPGDNGAVTHSHQTSGGFSGASSVRAVWTTAPTSPSGGILVGPSPVTPGATYTGSIYFRTNSTRQVQIEVKYVDASNSPLLFTGYVPATATTSWQRISHTSTAPANSVGMFVNIISIGTSANWAVGDYIEADATMVTQGSTLYKFADGSASSWIWNGVSNASTSAGPPL